MNRTAMHAQRQFENIKRLRLHERVLGHVHRRAGNIARRQQGNWKDYLGKCLQYRQKGWWKETQKHIQLAQKARSPFGHLLHKTKGVRGGWEHPGWNVTGTAGGRKLGIGSSGKQQKRTSSTALRTLGWEAAIHVGKHDRRVPAVLIRRVAFEADDIRIDGHQLHDPRVPGLVAKLVHSHWVAVHRHQISAAVTRSADAVRAAVHVH